MLTKKIFARILHPGLYIFGLLFLLSMCASNAQKNQVEGIRFLHLKISHDGVSLIESSMTEGRLKQPRRTAHVPGIHYEVLGHDDVVVWKDVIENPLRQRVEYVDEDGQLRSMFVEKDEAEAFIRIPHRSDVSVVRFYLIEERAGELQKGNVQGIHIGSIQLR